MKLVSQIVTIFSLFFSLSAFAIEAKFYKIEGTRENGQSCTVEISFGKNQHGDFPFIAYYGDVLSFIQLESDQIEEFYQVNSGLREVKFEGEHVWTYSKIRIFFDAKRRPIKAQAKLRPYLSPFWDKDECSLKSPRIDF